MTRHLATDLTPVDGDEEVVIFVGAHAYDPEAPEGERTTTALMKKPFSSATDYGPSVYVISKASIADLERQQPRWADFGYATLKVSELRALGVDPRYSPQDCPWPDPEFQASHASLVGVDKEKRDKVVALVDANLRRPPKPRP